MFISCVYADPSSFHVILAQREVNLYHRGVEQTLTVDGTTYELVGVQREGMSAVYRGEGCYLRIGEKAKIERDLALHKKMEAAGFPVARLLGEGMYEDMAYFVEASLGERRLGIAFGDEYEESGAVHAETFSELIAVTERHVRAQLQTQISEPLWDEFAAGIRLDELCKELPDDAERIRARFAEAKKKLASFPFVVTHGDFNTQNLYRDGVIDLEDSFFAPIGYDPISVLTTIDAAPDSQEYEFFARYRLSADQRAVYLHAVDAIAREGGLPAFSAQEDSFAFCRYVWLAVGMQRWPKIQAWRYDMLKKHFL